MAASQERTEAPAQNMGGGFRVPKVPGMAWCQTEDEPARRHCGAGNHRVVIVAAQEEEQ